MLRQFYLVSIITLVVIAGVGYFWRPFWWLYAVTMPVFLLGVYDSLQRKHTIMRNYPLLGRGRFLMEKLRPKIYQYFVESDIDGRPFDRKYRSIAYSRAKKENDTNPFGTQRDVYKVGYEWINHSLTAYPYDELDKDPRVLIGEGTCSKPYSASIFNISAMSFGSLSKNAIRALNGGAKIGGFYHNTGEGGLSHHHLHFGGDIVWQIGTAYFGCRDEKGNFSEEHFKEKAQHECVKMIEVKLSQGAKPSHGGILPAIKNTPEIAAIRHIKPHETVLSPPTHSEFSTPIEMMHYIARLRDISGGKPVGFKICIGRWSEFFAICKAMVKTEITPDFVTVDGGEGGTGAAPLEFSDSVGNPMVDSVAFAYDALNGFGLKDKVKLIASGKIITGFHILRALALGADLCNSARGMMFALGCIQALECNMNTCPTGVTTQDPALIRGLVVNDKKYRVANFHSETIEGFLELFAATGLKDHSQIHRDLVYKRVSMEKIMRYDELYPPVLADSLKDKIPPEKYRIHLEESNENSFTPGYKSL
ncbi:MAG: FMN-binding glutamate synthase family protein [Ignavibacteriae bacterium]|nr:FMN-binding glutamate synthase family protein [Ignavibacteriota bacterium]